MTLMRPEAYFWAEGDEIRRAFVLDLMADSEVDGKILVQNMEMVFQWLKGGTTPLNPDKKVKLNAV